MRVAVVIPARFAATRLPGKPLLAETGTPLIAHVVAQARAARSPSMVVVATDHAGVADAARSAGAQAVMTGDHATGSERVAEAARRLDVDIVVNVQGDEPELEPGGIDAVVEACARSGAFAATLAAPFPDPLGTGPGSPRDPHTVKAYLGERSDGWRRAHWFTRAAPHAPIEREGPVFQHVGVYAYPKAALARFAAWSRTPAENYEMLEQLRILEHGETIAAALIEAARPGVDTPEDYAAFVTRFRQRP